MLLSFSKRNYLISTFILSIGWFTLNYTLFTQKAIVAYHPDLVGILEWSWIGQKEYFYKAFGNYMPVYPYLNYIYSLFFEDHDSMMANAYILKSVLILFDAATYALIVGFLKPKSISKTLFYCFLLFINIFIIYNSVFWGQSDGVHSFFLLFCFYFTVERKWGYVGIFFALAFFTKIVSIIFLPVFGLFILNEIICKRFSKQDFTSIILALICTALALSLPIILSGSLPRAWAQLNDFISNYNTVSGNAYNIWVLLTANIDLMLTEDTEYFFRNITYSKLGLILFITFYTVSIFPLLKELYKNVKNGTQHPIKTETLLFACILIPLVFFYFSTKIRERYAHPYLLFITLYCFYNRRYFFWFLATSVYFLQLEAVLQYTKTLPQIVAQFHTKTSIYSPQFISGLFLILIIYFIHLSYRKQRDPIEA